MKKQEVTIAIVSKEDCSLIIVLPSPVLEHPKLINQIRNIPDVIVLGGIIDKLNDGKKDENEFSIMSAKKDPPDFIIFFSQIEIIIKNYFGDELSIKQEDHSFNKDSDFYISDDEAKKSWEKFKPFIKKLFEDREKKLN